MRALIERVSEAKVEVDGGIVGQIDRGLLVYLGVEKGDGVDDAAYIVDKIQHVRIFEDDAGKMNQDVAQIGGVVLIISAFTLQADARKGRRPSFDNAAEPALANALYLNVVELLRATELKVQTGQFAAHMSVSVINDGPITLLIDSRKLF
jgi:D-tyrosyl-tRNA(Tyr) deacylase